MSEFVDYWRVESDSRLGRFYTVSRDVGGGFACSCKGWTLHTPRRDCRHIIYVRAGQGVVLDPLLRAVTLINNRETRKDKKNE